MSNTPLDTDAEDINEFLGIELGSHKIPLEDDIYIDVDKEQLDEVPERIKQNVMANIKHPRLVQCSIGYEYVDEEGYSHWINYIFDFQSSDFD